MAITYLKKATKTSATGESDVRTTVQTILDEIESGGDDTARAYASKFDKWDGDIVVTPDRIAAAADEVTQTLRDDIRFAHDNVRRFAEAQKAAMQDVETEIIPGLIAGHRHVPANAAGAYVPGGRYSHIASAIMTVTTASVAGVSHIAACSPPRPGVGVPDVLVGPGNQFVAEAKRILFGRVGIDMFAGPTESMVIADASADPNIVAWDLVGQAEHGYNSPVWLISLDRALAERVAELVPGIIETLPEPNQSSARDAWAAYGEIIITDTRDEAVKVSDDYASEHLQVQAADLEWWLANLTNYGSLFLGEETTVAFGDKCSGPNHVLPTKGAANYTGGLSVAKYMKTVTWQRMTREANRQIAPATARISRLEGMEGHARTADVRLEKYFPGVNFDLTGRD
jgi:sulfopropanediol 3-dehydrogenase